MIIEIHLLARLLRIPLLRVEGVVAIRDDGGVTREGRGHGPTGPRAIVLGAGAEDERGRAPALPVAAPPPTTLGRDLAAAESILASLSARDGRGRRRPSA